MYKINNEKILYTQIGNEGVIYDTLKNKYLSLNETMNFIINLVDEKKTQEQITIALIDKYDIDEQECERVVKKIITELVRKEILLAL